MSKSKILFQFSGSIACYKSCEIVSKLVQNNFDVQAVCSTNALKFIGAATLEGLTARAVYSDQYESGRMMAHIDLAKWADVAIVCPATANTINGLAAGVATDVIGALFLAYDFKSKPYLVAPAMNQQMFAHPAVRASIRRLENWGVSVLPTDVGHQACGDTGAGRLLDPEKIYAALVAAAAGASIEAAGLNNR